MRQPHLRRGVGAKTIELMDLPEFGRKRRGRDAVADLPTGAVVGFPKGKTREGPLPERRKAEYAGVAIAVEGDVLVYFIAHDEDVRPFDQRLKGLKVAFFPHGAGGVVRGVEQDHPGFWSDGVFYAVPIDRIVRKG